MGQQHLRDALRKLGNCVLTGTLFLATVIRLDEEEDARVEDTNNLVQNKALWKRVGDHPTHSFIIEVTSYLFREEVLCNHPSGCE